MAKIPILRVYDDNGNEIPIPAIQGPKSENVFIPVYGETTYAELQEAHNAGKAMALSVDGMQIPFCKLDGSSYSFQINRYSTFYSYWCNPWNGWGGKTVALPMKHASRHAAGGDDPISPADFGAAVNMDFILPVGLPWTARSTGGYTKTIYKKEVLATDKPIVDVVLTTDTDANELSLEAFSKVTRVRTNNNYVYLDCDGEAPTVNFTINVKVVR